MNGCEICGQTAGSDHCVHCRVLHEDGLRTFSRVIHACAQCGHLTVFGAGADAAYYQSLPGSSQWSKGAYGSRFAQIRRVLPPGARILDIGCYNAEYLVDNFRGYELFGVEINPHAAALARARGVAVIGSTVQEVAALYEGMFDVVFLFDIIEHVPDPHELMRCVSRLIAHSGLLFVETGCADSLTARLLGRHWYYVRLFEHLRAFSRGSMSLLLDQYGYTTEEISLGNHMPDSWLSLPWLPSAFRLASDLFGLDQRLRGALGPAFLPVADHMFVRGRRRP